ncbi:hypothetical protein L6452_38853 [Arctium lappa]|uniref:Uncharacterized protein n=1 Tax=Arctium lappa TaxID=4217 RepID=A0ACB8XRV5_ARCLA|nr:hypothetical protein L6452_38853 [Arctium lappa]
MVTSPPGEDHHSSSSRRLHQLDLAIHHSSLHNLRRTSVEIFQRQQRCKVWGSRLGNSLGKENGWRSLTDKDKVAGTGRQTLITAHDAKSSSFLHHKYTPNNHKVKRFGGIGVVDF